MIVFLSRKRSVNLLQPSVVFHIETSQLICRANKMTIFYMKCKTWLKRVKQQPVRFCIQSIYSPYRLDESPCSSTIL